MTRGSEFVTCRMVLTMMVIFGFMLNYALRVNLTIAIVAMVKPHVPVNTTLPAGITNETVILGNITASARTAETTTLASPILQGNGTEAQEMKYFEWDEYEQNFILGAFFWGYILTEIPGGRLAELIGGHRVFGHSMLWASVLTLATPFAASINYVSIVIIRVLLGFFLGASWPAILPMTAVWIKPMDRSKFVSNMMASSLGAAITMPVCGFLISYCGWESVFYATGGIGILWSVAWFFIIYESPAVHPRISPQERKEIEDAIGAQGKKPKPSYVPWKSILTSAPVWAIVVTHGASVFGYFTVVNQLPTYMKYILQFNIKENGAFSSLPYLGKYIMAVTASFFADFLRQKKILSTTACRKIFTTFAIMIPGFFMILQIFVGEYRAWSVAIFTIALTFNGAVTGGYLGNGLDIAPNFSGTIFGMANTLSSFGGFVSAWMVGTLTHKNQVYGQWQIVFGILAATYIIGALTFVIFGSGEIQPWNNPPEKGDVYRANEEMQEGAPLKSKNNSAISA